MLTEKKRLDLLLVDKGLFSSREKARGSIMAGIVFVNGQREDKAGTLISADAKIEIKGETLPYVSRGGLKLAKALQEFQIDISGKQCLDIGASTGGFTDCMLQNGASKVTAVDVGYGQLAWKLRQDERVINLERKNIRYLTREDLAYSPEFISIDVSFISLEKILSTVAALITGECELVALIKPQFEAGREKVGKKGVVRDFAVHKEVILKVINCAMVNNFNFIDLTFSPIKGPEGNIEYLLYAKKQSENKQENLDLESVVDSVVESAKNME